MGVLKESSNLSASQQQRTKAKVEHHDLGQATLTKLSGHLILETEYTDG